MIEALRDLWRRDFSQWLEDSAAGYFATQFSENSVSNEDVAWTFRDMQRASFRAVFDVNRAQMEADWREEMRAIAVPALLIHGDADASIPLDLSSRKDGGAHRQQPAGGVRKCGPRPLRHPSRSAKR